MLSNFGNNWTQKIPLTAKLGEAVEFFYPIFSKLDSMLLFRHMDKTRRGGHFKSKASLRAILHDEVHASVLPRKDENILALFQK